MVVSSSTQALRGTGAYPALTRDGNAGHADCAADSECATGTCSDGKCVFDTPEPRLEYLQTLMAEFGACAGDDECEEGRCMEGKCTFETDSDRCFRTECEDCEDDSRCESGNCEIYRVSSTIIP